MNLLDTPIVPPAIHGARRVNLLDGQRNIVDTINKPPPADLPPGTVIELQQEPAMPRGVYERKPRNPKAASADEPKKRGGRPKKSKGKEGGLGIALVQLRAKRLVVAAELAKIDAAIDAVQALA